MEKVVLRTLVGHYVSIEVSAAKAVELLNGLKSELGKGGEDVEDAKRMIEHFEVFHGVMVKKFKDYLTPKKSLNDLLQGKVLVDKIKLVKRGTGNYVIIVLDKNVGLSEVQEALKRLGYEYEIQRS